MKPTDPTDDSTMRAGMAALVVAMKHRRPGSAAAPAVATTQMLDDEERDLLAGVPRRGLRLSMNTSGIARAFTANPRASILEPGTVVGRYVVRRRLGVGGMGVVYAAYDPELDRKVALKLLLAGAAGSTGRTRLLREAQALAKLSHPNVVAVHDVGSIGDRVWLAMELVRGQTLRQWLNAPHDWRDALKVMREAGKGLAAAHAAGLLHRDFKPDNVMVGDDGRVRVMDFGLARARPTVDPVKPSESHAIPTVATLTMSITQSGALVGTPYYMAPEQIGGEELTPAVDQFAFCLTLWEALYGERPFGGQTPMETFANVLGRGLRSPSKTRAVPSWLRRACERGLSIEPRDRWPSMDALLFELRPSRAPRRWWALAAGLAAVGIGIGQYAEVGFRCDGARAQLDGVWDQARKQEVKEAVLATGLSYAPDTWERVERGLDEYAKAWADKHTEVCEATSVRQEQSTEVMDLRMECLRERRVALREAAGVLAEVNARRVEKAVELVAALPGLSRCDDLEALRADLPPPEDPRVAEEVMELRDRLTKISALWDTGAQMQALAEIEPVEEQAEVLGYEPLLAEVALWRGRLRAWTAQDVDAEIDLRRAYRLAVRHAHRDVELDAAIELLLLVGARDGYEAAQRWREEAEERAQRQGANARARSWLSNNLGILLAMKGDLEEAQNHFEQALAIKRETLGSRHPDVAISLSNLGRVFAERGNLGPALEAHQEALSIYEETSGPLHPQVALSLASIGNVLYRQGKLEDAKAYYQRSLSLWEETLGHGAPVTSLPLLGLAKIALDGHDHSSARNRAERAVALGKTKGFSTHHVAEARFTLARALWPDRFQRTRARALAEQAREAFAGQRGLMKKEHAEVQAWLAEHQAEETKLQ